MDHPGLSIVSLPPAAALASLETKAHLELLVARGQATRQVTDEGVVFTARG